MLQSHNYIVHSDNELRGYVPNTHSVYIYTTCLTPSYTQMTLTNIRLSKRSQTQRVDNELFQVYKSQTKAKLIYGIRSQENFFRREQLPARSSKGMSRVLAIDLFHSLGFVNMTVFSCENSLYAVHLKFAHLWLLWLWSSLLCLTVSFT